MDQQTLFEQIKIAFDSCLYKIDKEIWRYSQHPTEVRRDDIFETIEMARYTLLKKLSEMSAKEESQKDIKAAITPRSKKPT